MTSPLTAHCACATGYVEQFDTLLSELTVREMLLYTAELKCSLKESLAKKKRRVDQLLETLALERCAATMIGDSLARGISGGQARPLSPHARPCLLPAHGQPSMLLAAATITMLGCCSTMAVLVAACACCTWGWSTKLACTCSVTTPDREHPIAECGRLKSDNTGHLHLHVHADEAVQTLP